MKTEWNWTTVGAPMPDLAPYGLVGARCHYRNGDADVWICDRGSDLLPIVSVFTPKEG